MDLKERERVFDMGLVEEMEEQMGKPREVAGLKYDEGGERNLERG